MSSFGPHIHLEYTDRPIRYALIDPPPAKKIKRIKVRTRPITARDILDRVHREIAEHRYLHYSDPEHVVLTYQELNIVMASYAPDGVLYMERGGDNTIRIFGVEVRVV